MTNLLDETSQRLYVNISWSETLLSRLGRWVDLWFKRLRLPNDAWNADKLSDTSIRDLAGLVIQRLGENKGYSYQQAEEDVGTRKSLIKPYL